MVNHHRHIIVLGVDGLEVIEGLKLGIILSEVHSIARIETGFGQTRDAKREQQEAADDHHPGALDNCTAVPLSPVPLDTLDFHAPLLQLSLNVRRARCGVTAAVPAIVW